MEVSGQLHNPAVSPQGKKPPYPLGRRLCGPQRLSGSGGEEQNYLHCSSQQPNTGRPARSLVFENKALRTKPVPKKEADNL